MGCLDEYSNIPCFYDGSLECWNTSEVTDRYESCLLIFRQIFFWPGYQLLKYSRGDRYVPHVLDWRIFQQGYWLLGYVFCFRYGSYVLWSIIFQQGYWLLGYVFCFRYDRDVRVCRIFQQVLVNVFCGCSFRMEIIERIDHVDYREMKNWNCAHFRFYKPIHNRTSEGTLSPIMRDTDLWMEIENCKLIDYLINNQHTLAILQLFI